MLVEHLLRVLLGFVGDARVVGGTGEMVEKRVSIEIVM